MSNSLSLTEFGVSNFKLLSKGNRIDIKPYTFLFGPNGSGKSTLIKSMLFFKSLLENEFTYTSFLEKSVYKDNISYSNKDENISFSFIIKPNHFCFDTIPNPWSDGIEKFFPDLMKDRTQRIIDNSILSCTFHLNTDHSRFIIQDESTEFRLDASFANDHHYPQILNFNLGKVELQEDTFSRNSYDIVFELLDIVNRNDKSKRALLNEIVSMYLTKSSLSFPLIQYSVENYLVSSYLIESFADSFSNNELDFLISHFHNLEIILDREISFEELFTTVGDFTNIIISPYFHVINTILRDIFNKTHFLAPFRQNTGSFNAYDYNQDIHTPDLRGLLRYYNSKSYNQLSEPKNSPFKGIIFPKSLNPLERLKKSLKTIFDINDFSISLISENYSISFIEGNLTYTLNNGSSGLKHLFPILLKVASNDESIITIQQPELHLHPKLQCRFVDGLEEIRCGNHFVIETHSEHIIKKIQLLIARGKIKHDDVKVYFFDRTDNNTIIKELRINCKGHFIDVWPDGFFDDSYILAKELLTISKN